MPLPAEVKRLFARGRAAVLAWMQRLVPSERQRLFGLTIVVGGACGLAAVAFHIAIRFLSHRAIDRALSAHGATLFFGTLLVPALGGLLSGLLLQYVVPNARGSGIPQVKAAFALKGGLVPLRDSVGKFLVSTLQIGTGSSLGREGPTVQICGGIASTLGRLAGVSSQNLKRLLPVGAAAGIAAAFNAPIAAVTFTIEEIVGSLDQTLLSGVIVAAALAAVVERSVLGANPVFDFPQNYRLDSATSLLLYAALGLLAAGVSVVFTESLLRLRAWFRTQKRMPLWCQPAVGGLVTGALALVALLALRTRGVTGGGYETLGKALTGVLGVKVLLALCVLKMVATVSSYSSGGAGGIFAPSLFIGAMLGGAVGAVDMTLLHHPRDTMGAFALVGMGAVFAGIVRAPITSVLIIIEMTGGYSLALPLMIANMSAYALARYLRPSSIYEALLEQDGVHIATIATRETVGHIAMQQLLSEVPAFTSLSASLGRAELLKQARQAGRQEVFPVIDEAGRFVGVITTVDIRLLASEPHLDGVVTAQDVARPSIALRPQDDLRTAFECMVEHQVGQLPVVDADGRVLGLVGESAITRALIGANHGTAERSSDVAPASVLRPSG